MAFYNKYEVGTLYKVTDESIKLVSEENASYPGVPFRKFQGIGTAPKITTPSYSSYAFGQLVNLDTSIKEYLSAGTIVKFISNIAVYSNGEKLINDEYILVRLVYARSAVEYTIPETGQIVYPQLQTQFGKFAADELAYINDYVGIVKKKYLESFVMDPSVYEEIKQASKKKKVSAELRNKINNKQVFTIKNPKGFWWLRATKEQKFRKKDSFNRDNLVKQFPEEDASVSVVWDSNKTYKVKIMEYVTYSDEDATCGEEYSTQCPIALVARIDDELASNKYHHWADRDDQSTHFPQENSPDLALTPHAHWGYVPYSHLISALGTEPAPTPAATPPASPAAAPSTNRPEFDIDSADEFSRNEVKCKYYVKIKATYKGTDEQLKNDNFFNAAIKHDGFSKLLQNYNKIAAYEPFVWMNKDSGATSYKEEEKKILNEAFTKVVIQEKKRLDGPSGRVVVLLSVPTTLFDKIPDGPSLKPYISTQSDDHAINIYIKKEGPTFEDVITGTRPGAHYLKLHFTLDDIGQMADTFVNVFHRRYVSEYIKYVDLLYIDYQMEADYLMKFVNGIGKLARDNNLDLVASAGKHTHIRVHVDKNFRIKNVLYNKEGMFRGEYYKFKIGEQEFKSKNNNKSTNKLIHDLCRASIIHADTADTPKAREAETLRAGILDHMKSLHKVWSSPPSTACLAKYSGKSTDDTPPIIWENNFFFSQHYLEPRPRIKMRTRISTSRGADDFTEIPTFRIGPKSPIARSNEDRSISLLVKREGKELKKSGGSIFSDETNKFVGDLAKSKSVFNMILRSETFFGPKGLYQQLLNKTNLHVWIKSVFECAGYDLKGDDLFEVLCNIVLKNLPWDKIRDEVLMNLNEAAGEVTDWTTKALEDIYSEISTEDFDLNKAMTGMGDVLRYSDPKWYPGYDKTTQLYNALNMGKTPMGGPKSGPSLGSSGPGSTPTKCVEDSTIELLTPGAPKVSDKPEDEIPYLAHPDHVFTPGTKDSSSPVHSSGDAVFRWKVFLNYKLSTADPALLPDTIKYAFTEKEFAEYGATFNDKTKLATEKYSYYFRHGSLVKDYLGIDGVVSLEAYREAVTWWASVTPDERRKYASSITPPLLDAVNRFGVDNLEKVLVSLPILVEQEELTLSVLLNNHDLVIKEVRSERLVDGSKTTTAMLTLCLISKSSMESQASSGNIILAELMMSPSSVAPSTIDNKIKDFVEKLKQNLTEALIRLGIKDHPIVHSKELQAMEPSDFDKLVADTNQNTNQSTGEVVKYQSFLSQPKVPQDFQTWKAQLDDAIALGAFSKEGQIRLVTRLVSNYNLHLSTLVTSHCNPEFLCKHLEKYILDLMMFFETGDLSKIGLGKVSKFIKNFKIGDPLGTIGKLWVAAILKQLDQTLLESFKWLARYIQLNCELMMSEAGKALQTEVNKMDDGFWKDTSKFLSGIVNLDTEPDPDEAENIIQIAFPAQTAITNTSEPDDSYQFGGIDQYKVEDSKYDRIDVNKGQILREARKFIEILKPKDKEIIEAALKEVQGFLYRILLSYSSKKLVVLFSGNANTALLEEILILIEEKYASLNKILDSSQAINSFFNFVGASVDLELFINSIVSRKIIEDSCDLKELSEDVQLLSSKAILALEEQNRIRKEQMAKLTQMAIDNGALTGIPSMLEVDHSLIPYPDSIPFLDSAMQKVRDTIMDSVEMSYRSDVRNIRSIFVNFNIKLENKETGEVFDGMSELAGSLSSQGSTPAEVFDSYLNILADYASGGTDNINFGDGDYQIKMGLEQELYPELQDALEASTGLGKSIYKIAAVNGPGSPNDQRLDIFTSLDWSPSQFTNYYNIYIDPVSPDGEPLPKPNANFAFVMGINTLNEIEYPYDNGFSITNYDTYAVLDPFKNHATMDTIMVGGSSGKYTTAIINNENVMFSWQSGLFSDPSSIFGTEKVKTYTYGDPCTLDESIPKTSFEELNFKEQVFPAIDNPLLGNIAQNLPLDLKDFNPENFNANIKSALPQAKMFSKYVLNIFYKNVFEKAKGSYDTPPENISETIEKVESILEKYVFPRVTNNIIRSFGEYVSQSKYFNTKEVYKLTETLCDPTKIPFDLIGINEIKEDIVKRYAHYRKHFLIAEQADDDNEFDQAPINGAFERAMMEGTVRLTIRTYLAEILLRAVFLFDRFVFEDIIGNDMFLQLFASQFLVGIQTYTGQQDPEVFKTMFMIECRLLAKSRFEAGAMIPEKLTKKQILNSDVNLIKYLTLLEIGDIGAKINSLFGLQDNKSLKEIFFDDLKFGFLRNSGINFGQDTTPRSYFMFDYSDHYNATDLEPIANMAKKSQMVIDQASKQGAPDLDKAVYFDVDGEEIDYQTFPFKNTPEFKLGFGEFVIEPYVRLVDWEVGEQENIAAEAPNNNFPLTVFDNAFGPGGKIETDHDIEGYVRKDKYRGILSLRGLKNFAIDLMDHLISKAAENEDADGSNNLPAFGMHELPLTTFYKEIKWGTRLNLIIPADPYNNSLQPFEKLEEVFNKFFNAAEFENKWVPGIHKSYRIYRQVKNVDTGGYKKIPYFVIPLTYEEIDAHSGDEGVDIVGYATNLHNRSFKQIADVKPKSYKLLLARYLKYPSDDDVYRIKFNMGYRDPDYTPFEGDQPGSLVPLVIHSKRKGLQALDFEGNTSVESELITYYGKTYGKSANMVADYPGYIGDDLEVLQKYAEAWLEHEDWMKDQDPDDEMTKAIASSFTAFSKISEEYKPHQDIFAARNTLLETKYARNKFAQWMGIGVELDREPYVRTQNSIASIERDLTKPDYNPKKHPGLIGRPDFNVKFNVTYEGSDNNISYPHGAFDEGGCKEFGFKDYQKIFASVNASAYLSHVEAWRFNIDEWESVYNYQHDETYPPAPLYDNHYKNMSSYKVSRCKKSPSWDQIGAVYPSGEQVTAIKEWSDIGVEQTLTPIKLTMYDVFPPESYHWSHVSCANQEEFLTNIASTMTLDWKITAGQFISELAKDCIEKHIPDYDSEKGFEDVDKFLEWQANNEKNLDNFFSCINKTIGIQNQDIKGSYKQVVYKHPGGMPMAINSNVDHVGFDNKGKGGQVCLYSGVFANQVFRDVTETSVYGLDDSLDKYLKSIYDLNSTNYDLFTVDGENDSVLKVHPEFYPHSDNIDVSPRGLVPGVHGGHSYWGSYLNWSPGMKGPELGFGTAASLEPSQIWVKNADSIDFRELANKKTDYILERSGFMPSYYTGHKEPLSITTTLQKEFPIFDAISHTYKDENNSKPGIQSQSSLVEVLANHKDVYFENFDGEWHDNENIKPLPSQTPDNRLKYPRSKLDVWQIDIKRNDMSVWHPKYEITEDDIYSGKVDGIYKRYLKKPSGEIVKNTMTAQLKINKDTITTHKADMYKESTDPEKKGQLQDQTPLFLEDDNTWGGDLYIGLFPAAEDLLNLKKLIQGLNIWKGKINRQIFGTGYNWGGPVSEAFDWVYVDSTSEKPLTLPKYNEEKGPDAFLASEIFDLLFGGGPSSQSERTLINPLVVNQGAGIGGAVLGAKWNDHSSLVLDSMSSVEEVLQGSSLYYIAAGLNQIDPAGSDLSALNWAETGPDYQPPKEAIYAGDYDDLPPDVKQYYIKTNSPDNDVIHGRPAIELKVKMKKEDYMEYAGSQDYLNKYFQKGDVDPETGHMEFKIKLYQVRLRSANALKLGDFEYGVKMKVNEIIQENDASVFIREFLVGDLIKKQNQEAAGDISLGVTSIYEYLKNKMINGPDGSGSKEFQLLFNYIFPLKQYAAFVAVHTMFYSLYKKGTAFDTNEKMRRLFTNTKIDLYDLFSLLTTGGDPNKRFGPSNLEENIVSIREADAINVHGVKGLSAFAEKQNQILQQLHDEGLDPGFFAPFTQKDHSNQGQNHVRILFEVLAEMVDPGFDSFPITPFGWIALLLRQSAREQAGLPKMIPGEYIDPDDTSLCKDE